MTKREAAIELKRRGWTRVKGLYIPPKKRGAPRIGIDMPKTGLIFREACSFELICFTNG